MSDNEKPTEWHEIEAIEKKMEENDQRLKLLDEFENLKPKSSV